MSKLTSASTRHFGKVFDDVASDYDRNRPGYPEELIDRACKVAKLESGDRVLELGCGSGQLTRALVARGLQVTAVEPGAQLIAFAKKNVKELGGAEFIHARFEDAALSKGHYKAVFSASAFHWIDPDVSWQKVADLLMPSGMLALIQYFGLKEQHTASDLAMQLAAMKEVAPEIAAGWPQYYDLDEIIDGASKRCKNISEVWSWLGNYDLARSSVPHLFGDVQIAAVPTRIEQTADEIIALIRTTSPYGRLSNKQRQSLEHEYSEIYKKLGRPIHSSIVNVLITAQRSMGS
jgi:ubiquinone/menaquinone biosynthesis C-methylase UbiE